MAYGLSGACGQYVQPVVMESGFSFYTVSNGVIDAGTFVPITLPTQ